MYVPVLESLEQMLNNEFILKEVKLAIIMVHFSHCKMQTAGYNQFFASLFGLQSLVCFSHQ